MRASPIFGGFRLLQIFSTWNSPNLTTPCSKRIWRPRLTTVRSKVLSDLPIIVGKLGPFLIPADYPYAPTVNTALADLPNQLPHTGYADSTGLHDKGDSLHFDAASARELGARFAAAWLTLTVKSDATPAPSSAP